MLPAAGVGSRMQAAVAKQYLLLNAKPVIEHCIEQLLRHDAIERVIVALHPNDKHFQMLACANDPRVHTVVGGKDRVDSVLAGLKAYADIANAATDSPHGVLVHDAARPCITHQEIEQLLMHYESLVRLEEEKPADTAEANFGAILATPVVDTIKMAQAHDISLRSTSAIEKTIDRNLLWQAQTPQIFPLHALINAIETGLKNNRVITDEASAMEYLGATVQLVEGRSSNIKITRPCDLSLAEFYLNYNNKET
ncbi:2-C-methyl-D-erythritol 4-phosphate cytidylyltransferase [Glaciecola sp. MH2013]|uniref:2-C-methyl-D-erythritol 4-phosphate cytidylyltransferase n=1 Tax=Glaciecola sp. MH2013 TaxID=2785524 RepID=UPI00351C0ECC